jgi:hypothetical protein
MLVLAYSGTLKIPTISAAKIAPSLPAKNTDKPSEIDSLGEEGVGI